MIKIDIEENIDPRIACVKSKEEFDEVVLSMESKEVEDVNK